ncbi:hypothetical protein Tsubulata_049728 [Turnera subulata]|uniref:DUF4283 domain-containing protein n=1 Tax=Turnera subulata TaxID=218843 RepID=A0A9Q0FDD0_9ROSI|nr:hypothetical protein Tsubulata_049728 [Turnera subulata]
MYTMTPHSFSSSFFLIFPCSFSFGEICVSYLWNLYQLVLFFYLLGFKVSSIKGSNNPVVDLRDNYPSNFYKPAIYLESDDEAAPVPVRHMLVGKVIADFCRVLRARVLVESPWNVSGFHICLKEWSDNVVLNSIKFDSLEFWIQVRGLPPHHMKKYKAERLACLFHEILEIELPEDNSPFYGDCYRMKVSVLTKDPLPSGFITQGLNDTMARVNFHYKIADVCYYYGWVGHVEKDAGKGSLKAREASGVVCASTICRPVPGMEAASMSYMPRAPAMPTVAACGHVAPEDDTIKVGFIGQHGSFFGPSFFRHGSQAKRADGKPTPRKRKGQTISSQAKKARATGLFPTFGTLKSKGQAEHKSLAGCDVMRLSSVKSLSEGSSVVAAPGSSFSLCKNFPSMSLKKLARNPLVAVSTPFPKR